MMIPNEQGQILQPNNGEKRGNIFASFNIDLLANRGLIRSAGSLSKSIDQNDDVDFDAYAAAIGYNDGKMFAASNEMFSGTLTDPGGTWTEEAGTEVSSDLKDADYFDGKYLVSQGTDIRSWTSSGSSSWWQGTLSQSALSSLERILVKTGSDGNFYVVNGGQNVYRVDKDGSTVTKTGEGTLDISNTAYKFTTMETSSTRLWLGTEHTQEGEAVIYEWDMAPNSISANKLHPMGAEAVRCIAIWNDTPVALLSNGRVKYHNGSSFVDWPGGDLQTYQEDLQMESDYVHPNGWAIIDGIPHFLIKGNTKNTTTYRSNTRTPHYIPSGIWCLDPEVGLYHRFAIGAVKGTQLDYGQVSVSKVGALWAPENYYAKFFASYEYYEDISTTKSVLAYFDRANSDPHKAWFITQPQTLAEVASQVQILHKKLNSGDEINLSYRIHSQDTIIMDGAWEETDRFNTTDSFGDAEVGDLVLVKNGSGAGQLLRISKLENSGSTNSISFSNANSLATANDTATVEVLKFKKLGSITGTGKDNEIFNIPNETKNRKIQLLVELSAVGSDFIELDNVII